MRELLKVYEESLQRLQRRREEILAKQQAYDKRVALLEEEMDELQEAMCMMRTFLGD